MEQHVAVYVSSIFGTIFALETKNEDSLTKKEIIKNEGSGYHRSQKSYNFI